MKKLPHKLGRERIYNKNFDKIRQNVVLWEVIKIKQHQDLELRFISTNSKYKQGIRLSIDAGQGEIMVNGIKSRGIEIWEDDFSETITLSCYSSEEVLSVYNIFDLDKEHGGRRSQAPSCGMIIEQNNNIYRFHCNDAGFQTNFDKLVFEIKLL